jgi:hypothetical protein
MASKGLVRRGIEQQEAAVHIHRQHALAHAVDDQVQHPVFLADVRERRIQLATAQLQRVGHAVEGAGQVAEFAPVGRPDLDPGRKVADGQFVGFAQDGVGRPDDQALTQPPGASHAERGGDNQHRQFGQKQLARCRRRQRARLAQRHEQRFLRRAGHRGIGIQARLAVGVGRLARARAHGRQNGPDRGIGLQAANPRQARWMHRQQGAAAVQQHRAGIDRQGGRGQHRGKGMVVDQHENHRDQHLSRAVHRQRKPKPRFAAAAAMAVVADDKAAARQR